jgi:hypothetical protein
MKFFGKKPDSKILQDGLVYKKNNAINNSKLKELLINEQYNFCAYTEKYFDHLDSIDVEHFDSSIKGVDDYYNYYAVLHKPNLIFKKDEKYKNSTFFESKFFQSELQLTKRIKYIKGEFIFEEVDINDTEARDFIDFLGINNPDLVSARRNHCNRLKDIFDSIEGFTNQDKLIFFAKHKTEMNFVTALEMELEIDLSSIYLI